MNREYKIKLDLRFNKTYNQNISFGINDVNTSDFYIELLSGGNDISIPNDAIVALGVIKPDGTTDAQFIEFTGNKLYCNLLPNMKNQIGVYQAQAILITEEKRVVTEVIHYCVNRDMVVEQLQIEIAEDVRYPILTDMINRLGVMESNEVIRISNEITRKSNESNRVIEHSNRIDEHNIKMQEVADSIVAINQAIASGTIDLEVKYARIGQDGVVYDSLNDRLTAMENMPYVLFETVEG